MEYESPISRQEADARPLPDEFTRLVEGVLDRVAAPVDTSGDRHYSFPVGMAEVHVTETTEGEDPDFGLLAVISDKAGLDLIEAMSNSAWSVRVNQPVEHDAGRGQRIVDATFYEYAGNGGLVVVRETTHVQRRSETGEWIDAVESGHAANPQERLGAAGLAMFKPAEVLSIRTRDYTSGDAQYLTSLLGE